MVSVGRYINTKTHKEATDVENLELDFVHQDTSDDTTQRMISEGYRTFQMGSRLPSQTSLLEKRYLENE